VLELATIPCDDLPRAERNLAALRQRVGTQGYAELEAALITALHDSADADLALNNLERFLATEHGLAALPELLAQEARGLNAMLVLLAVSQFFGDTLVRYPEAIELIRQTPRRNPLTDELTAQLRGEADNAADDQHLLRVFRRFRHLHMLRIGVNDILLERPLEEVTRELARVADSSIKIALHCANRTLTRKFGTPTTPRGQPCRVGAFAFGKLGGDELNYSSDIDLLFVFDEDGETNRRSGAITNAEYYAKLVAEIVRLLSSVTEDGFAYRVDLRLRPEGSTGPLARSFASTLSYYDLRGRTWERQALIKLRPVAGDRSLRQEVMAALEPFVYRTYFSFSEINEIKALKRRMEQHATTRSGTETLEVKTGRGGIRDIEYTVQFLQLLNGGDLPAVRQRNTLLALEALEIAGCLNSEETYLLSDSYRFLRRVEHRLQLVFDWQTHKLPQSTQELRKLAQRMGYTAAQLPAHKPETPLAPDEASATPLPTMAQRRSPLDEQQTQRLATRDLLVDPLELFLKDYHDKTAINRRVLDHLLHQSFTSEDDQYEPETDLLLDPAPDDVTIAGVLQRYPFKNGRGAYANLSRLAQEVVPFLSHRRCRHFLASIAPRLLRAVADTPDPDATLNNLERVTASLGAKAVLYELFNFNPPSLKLYVDICANSPYLCSILTNNPGMIDELLDSLVLDQQRKPQELKDELGELLRGASDVAPILRSFQDKERLRIGVQDVLGKLKIEETTEYLSDVADALVCAAFDLGEIAVQQRQPTLARALQLQTQPLNYVVLGLGKLGGREISYHSDVDLVVVYDAPSCDPDIQHYVTLVTQQALKILSQQGPQGRLYEVDMRLRPTGGSGSLTISLSEFARYYQHGGQLWERQALTRARVIRGEHGFAETVAAAIQHAILQHWQPKHAREIMAMRTRLEQPASARCLKRGKGGLTDVEFVVQLLQLKYGQATPQILQPNCTLALQAIRTAGYLNATDASLLLEGYSFLRYVEARLRLVTDRPLTELPLAADDLTKLARRLGFEYPEPFLERLQAHRDAIRRVYTNTCNREAHVA
jgi:glutamate-ammonia-ligase adenylyltransferase